MTEGMMVSPGRKVQPVSFRDYFMKNWDKNSGPLPIRKMWVEFARKNQPTLGIRSTNSSESSFRAVKHYIKTEFGQRKPTMAELICFLLKLIELRLISRVNKADSQRINIFDPNPIFHEALQLASWHLNARGLKLFYCPNFRTTN